MNHLAHALIAVRTGTSIVGNLMGDFVKGRPEDRYDGALLRGIRVHRAVDAYVEEHPAFARSRARLDASLRRFSGILVDLAYDHALATRWEDFGEGTLRSFADRVYAEIEVAHAELPERMHRFVAYMTSTDLLVAYREPAGITRALEGMSMRMRHANPLGEAAADVTRAAPQFAEDFAVLWPDVVAAASHAAAAAGTSAREER